MDLHSENVQTGLPRPDADAGIEPATRENIDFDYEILDVVSQILDVAATLAVQAGGITSSCDQSLHCKKLCRWSSSEVHVGSGVFSSGP